MQRGRASVLAAAVATALLACQSTLSVLGDVPSFSLTERSRSPLRAADLARHVWIADFVFTRCPDVCPALTARMRKLQDLLDAKDDPVRLVSFTVDPVHDT